VGTDPRAVATDRRVTRDEGAAAATFAELGVAAPLVAALVGTGITAPFPIQAATIPDALAGRDVLGRGQTGSGKTIAFAVPVTATVAGAARRRPAGHPGALVVVPTRELAAQVARTMRPLAAALGLRCATVYGGVAPGPQVAALRGGADIVIATPGRLEDLIGQGHCGLGEVLISVLDEADHLADLGFLPAVTRLLDRTPRDAQRLMFSATLDHGVDTLVRRYLSDPVVHSVDPPEASPARLEHHLFSVQSGHKTAVVTDLASGRGRSLLFTRTKHGARKLTRQLVSAGIPAVDLHGNLSQSARQRNLAAFTDGSVRVLVATDIAARGIHVDDVALVVHVDPPAEHKAYLHRSGRTARAGAAGVVVTVVTPDQAREVRALVRQAGIQPATADIVPGAPQTRVLTGPPADRQPADAPVTGARPVRTARFDATPPVRATRRGPKARPGPSRRHGPIAR